MKKLLFSSLLISMFSISPLAAHATTWYTVIDDNFQRSDTSTGGAGSTSGAGNGWIDTAGGVWSIGSNKLQGFSNTSSDFLTKALLRPSSENTLDQRIVATIPAGENYAQFLGLALRKQTGTNDYYLAHLNGSGVWIYKIVGGVTTLVKTVAVSINSTHINRIDFAATSSSPTNFLLSVYDVTNSTQLVSTSATDSAASLQTTGSLGLTTWYNSGSTLTHVTSVQTYSSIASAPTVSSFTPADNATSVNPASNLSIVFSAAVSTSTGDITIRKVSDDSLVESIPVTGPLVSGGGTNTITINPASNLADTTAYYVTIPATAFKDGSNNFYAGTAASTTWNFTTADATNPSVSSLSPSDNATGVSVDSNLVVTFTEAVDAETGSIVIKKSSDDSIVETIDVTGGQVTGTGTNTITINPTSDLSAGTEYYITIGATAFDDAAGNSFAGISDSATWSFTTLALATEKKTGSTARARVNNLTTRGNTERADIIIEQWPEIFGVRNNGIQQTSTTANKPVTDSVRDLRKGMSGDDVRMLQQILINQNHPIPSGPTGFFGDETKAALISYQRRLSVDPAIGYFGPITRAYMQELNIAGLWW